MYSESLEDQGSEKSSGPVVEYNDDVPNGNTLHSDNPGEVGDFSGEDDMDYTEAGEQQDDCDKDPLAEIQTPPTQVDRENEVPIKKEQNGQQEMTHHDQEQEHQLWYLPGNRDVCTLEEIRRGQVINKTAPNECPVPGCGKKINEMRVDPTPGTISSGLRTHVLFVHYGVSPNRKITKKKRTLGWGKVEGLRTSPRKLATHTSQMLAATSRQHQDSEIDYSNINSSDISNSLSSLIQKSSTPINLSRPDVTRMPKKPNQDNQYIHQISSLQSLIQASGNPKTTARPVKKQQQQDISATQRQNQIDPMTSSLFSILAGLTQQQKPNPSQQLHQHQQPMKNNYKSTQSNSSVNLSRASNTNNNRPANSSLLSLLNEQISGNVASSLQNQLRKTMTTDGRSKASNSRQYSDPNSYIQSTNNESNNGVHNNINNISNNYNGGSTSILNGLVSNNGDNRISLDNSIPIHSFVETIASKTGCNIGPLGIAQVKKMLEKFTASLLYSSQTIADHYLEPFSTDMMQQQKPEISASDVILAYKMMLKTHGQT